MALLSACSKAFKKHVCMLKFAFFFLTRQCCHVMQKIFVATVYASQKGSCGNMVKLALLLLHLALVTCNFPCTVCTFITLATAFHHYFVSCF